MSFVPVEHCAVDMNSINIISGSTAASSGLLTTRNRSLNTSRLSVDRRSLYASSGSMAAAIVASKGQAQEADDHSHKLIKVNDPVVLRTCTVDESFRRMEVGDLLSEISVVSY